MITEPVAATDVELPAPRPVTPMGILAELLENIDRQVREQSDVSDELRTAAARAVRLARGLDPYLEECTSPESDALAEVTRRTQAVDWAEHRGSVAPLEQEMLSGHVEGQLLKMLVHATSATRVLEIGMFTGYSALAMAEALPAGGTVDACELDPFAAHLAQECFDASPHGSKISVHLGPALASIHRLARDHQNAEQPELTYGLVFIDADKQGYTGYLKALLDLGLLAPHGLIVVDNTLLQGEAYLSGTRSVNGDAIAAFNAGVAAEHRVEQVLLPVRDGITLIRQMS